ncbi:MAG TPA: hypothetical protein VN657_10750 [Nitrospiraceae bacterium]|nr:hypothetical protein [Nitrospiraceae bacterium]
MRTQGFIAFTVMISLVSLMAGSALADSEGGSLNAFLQGTYRHSTTLTCAVVPGSSGTPNFLATGPGGTQHITWTGDITYHGNGYATGIGQGIIILPGPYNVNSPTLITFAEEKCRYTYVVHPNGRFSQAGDCAGIDPDGPPGVPGSTYTLTDTKMMGQIGVDGQVLIYSQIKPVEQTVVSGTYSAKQLCGLQGTAVRIR